MNLEAALSKPIPPEPPFEPGNRASRRRLARDKKRKPLEACPVRISEVPKNEAERQQLQKQCLLVAKRMGHRGVQAKVAATRYYNAAVTEASRKVREPGTQQTIVAAPETTFPTPAAPRGMTQRESGLYVPQETQ